MKVARVMSVLAMAVVLGSARASEPLPQERQWEAVVTSLVQLIVEQGDPKHLTPIAAPTAFAAPFDMNRTESFLLLPDRLVTTNVVSARAYFHPSVSCASDIVADLTSNGTIDQETMRKLVPQNEGDLRRADATMARWFEAALEVKSGDPIAAIVLYDDGKGEPVRKPQLYFILLRGDLSSAGQPRISRALYGSMESALK